MDENIQKIKKMTKFMRANGILKLKSGDLELELSPQALFQKPEKPEPKLTEKQQSEQTQNIEEQQKAVLLWSSPLANQIPG